MADGTCTEHLSIRPELVSRSLESLVSLVSLRTSTYFEFNMKTLPANPTR